MSAPTPFRKRLPKSSTRWPTGWRRTSAARDRCIANLFRRKREVPKGLYIWGDVGRGKTMLMDLFYETVPLGGQAAGAFSRIHE